MCNVTDNNICWLVDVSARAWRMASLRGKVHVNFHQTFTILYRFSSQKQSDYRTQLALRIESGIEIFRFVFIFRFPSSLCELFVIIQQV